MQGRKELRAKLHHAVCLEDLVPGDDFYRKLERVVDLSWVGPKVAHRYAPIGRPSVDPAVIVKIELIGYLEGITSERALMRQIADRLSLRRYIGYDLDEEVPDHSTLSKARDLLGRGLFQAVFDHTVRLCQGAGMVGGVHLSGDKTILKADASLDSLSPRLVHESPEAFVERLFTQNPSLSEQPAAQVSDLTQRDDYPTRLGGGGGEGVAPSRRSQSQRKAKRKGRGGKGVLSNQSHYSTSDPDATLVAREDLPPQLAYKAEVWSDARAGVITHADLGPGNEPEDVTTLAAIVRQKGVFALRVASVSLDRAYAQGRLWAQLERLGVKGYIPPPKPSPPTSEPKLFALADFVYLPGRRAYRCPAGEELAYSYLKVTWPRASHIWQARPSDCGGCGLRSKCTKASRYRRLQVSIYQPAYEAMAQRQRERGARLAAVARRTGPEVRFAQGKRWQGLGRAKYRGQDKVGGQVLLTAAAQNLKKLVAWVYRQTGGAAKAQLQTLASLIAPRPRPLSLLSSQT